MITSDISDNKKAFQWEGIFIKNKRETNLPAEQTRNVAGSHYANLLDVRIRVIIVRFYKSPRITGVVKASQRMYNQ